MERDQFLAEVGRARAGFPAGLRIASFAGTEGGRFWLKQVEHLSLRARLTKGSARRSFENDRTGLHVLADAGLPVAPILVEGPDFFVTPDLGPTLHAMVQDDACPPETRLAAFAATGAALARMHRRGLCHGRPAPRDTCWDGTTARFIDLERFSAGRTGPAAFADDLMLFVFGSFATGLDIRAELDTMMRGYFARAPQGVRQALQRRSRRLVWLRPAMALARRIRPDSRELRSVIDALDYVTGAQWDVGAA